MKLDELLKRSGVKPAVAPPAGVDASGIAYDSRLVEKNFLFFAIRGTHADGGDFAGEAKKRGASAVVSENSLGSELPEVIVGDVKRALARISESFYGNPSGKVDIFAVTGTNGKTTVTYMLESIARAGGVMSAVFGTVNYRWEGTEIELPNTTAESADISRFLAEFLKAGGRQAAVEISSQGLDRKCAEAIKLRCAIFTNLTHEHLDWHKSVENYAKAKRRLFELLSVNYSVRPLAVVNSDDPKSRVLTEGLPLDVVTYGIKRGADYSAEIISEGLDGTVFNVKHVSGAEKITIKLPGRFNVYNALAAYAAARETGTGTEVIKKGLAALTDVPGRMTRFPSPGGFTVYVDYSHTPDALEKALRTLRRLGTGRLISVFGAGGDRDRTKRPEMGEISAAEADFSWITSDNPRTEAPDAIALDIEVGFRKVNKTNFKVELDRAEAIKNAIGMAQRGDVILIAGKGHEDYQITGDKKIHYSDIETVRKYLYAAGRPPEDGSARG